VLILGVVVVGSFWWEDLLVVIEGFLGREGIFLGLVGRG
jgi:hypothetical protein